MFCAVVSVRVMNEGHGMLTGWVSYLGGRRLLRESVLLALWALMIVGLTVHAHVEII
jgi:hypothetical protein